jgi:plasmid rolling circle replication initiator protein Rep
MVETKSQCFAESARTGVIFLEDKSSSGRARPWAKKKKSNVILEDIYRSLSLFDDDYYSAKADRLHDCASVLVFNQLEKDSLERLQLDHMTSCRVRLCPMCAWRRTLKIGSHARKIFSYLETDAKYKDKYTYLFLPLTVPNCVGEELSNTIDWLMLSFARLMDRIEVKRVVHGWYRGLEVTHNHVVGSKSYNTYHPHFHVILVVEKSYLDKQDASRGYITQSQWQRLWGESLGWFKHQKFMNQKEYVNKILGDFKKYKKYKQYTYNWEKVDVSKLPKKQQEYIATHLWNQWVLKMKRTKPRPHIVTRRLDQAEYCQLIKKYSNPHGVLCEAERMLAVKSVGNERKNCVKYGFSPSEWLYNHNYDNMVSLFANRLMLQVDIRAVKPKDKNANSDNPLERSGLINSICEITKYTVKEKDYIMPYDWELSSSVVSVLDSALANRRLVAWGGLLAKVRELLQLDDEIDGDLTHIDDDSLLPTDKEVMQACFFWNVGYQQYVLHSINFGERMF